MIQVFKLKFQTPNGFRIGSKAERNLLTQLRIDTETVLIPASSWKGVFRRVSEIVLNGSERNAVKDGEVDAIIKDAKDLIKTDLRFRKIAESHELIEVNQEVKDAKSLAEAYKEYSSPIERLYGGKYFAGYITISDTVIQDAELEQRAHVTIDRKSRKNLERHLYAEEIVNVNSIKVNVIVRGEFELWKSTLKFLRDIGYFIGAGKSRGIGYIKLDDKESMYAVIDKLKDRPKFDILSKYLV